MPAKAPRPGSLAEAKDARTFMRVQVKDDEYDLIPDLSIQERFVVRSATGLPFEAFLPKRNTNSVGEDSLFVLWWIARRQNGEPALSFARAEMDWPLLGLGVGDLGLTIVDLDDEPEDEDSPEGSGPDSAP